MGKSSIRWLPGALLEPGMPKSQSGASPALGVHSWDPAWGGKGRAQLHLAPLAVAGTGTIRSYLKEGQGDDFREVGRAPEPT